MPGVTNAIAVPTRERVERGLVPEREDEVLTRDAELARSAVQSGEGDLLERGLDVARVRPRPCGARIGDGCRSIGRTTERGVRDEHESDRPERDEQRDETLHSGVHRLSAAGTSAKSASAAASRNGVENAFVTARWS